jgi:hypothetical protein
VPVHKKTYEVESILGHRLEKNEKVIKFQVKWQGYDENEATWEPFSHLKGSPAVYRMVSDYVSTIKQVH